MTNRNTSYNSHGSTPTLFETGTAVLPGTTNTAWVAVADGIDWYNNDGSLEEKVTCDSYRFSNFGGFPAIAFTDSQPVWIRVEYQGSHVDDIGNGTPRLQIRVKKSDAAEVSSVVNTGVFNSNFPVVADADVYQVIANSTDATTKLFGLTLTKAEVQSSQFSIVANFLGDATSGGGHTAWCYVDHIRVRIEYDLRVAPAQFNSTTTLNPVTFGHIITVPAGAVAITGYAPTVAVSDHKLVAVPAGAVAITGYAPAVAVSDHKLVAVPAGTVAITGYAPAVAVSDHKLVAVPAGTVVVSGLSPVVTVTDFKLIQVPVGTVTVTGYAPSATVATPLAPVLSLVAATSITAKTIIPQVVINF